MLVQHARLLNLVNIVSLKTGLLFTDPIRVGYERSEYTTDEGQMEVELCAIIYEPPSRVAPRPFFIFASTMDGTAGTYTYIHCTYHCQCIKWLVIYHIE